MNKNLQHPRHQITLKESQRPDATASIEDQLNYLDQLVDTAKESGDPNDAWKVVDYVWDMNLSKPSKFTESSDKSTYHESLKKSIQSRLSEDKDTPEEKPTIDYDHMKYWNPVAIGSKLAEILGVDATAKQIMSEINKIITPDNYKEYKAARRRALSTALKDIETEKETANEDPMDGHKYRVSGATPNVTETGTDYNISDGGYFDDPQKAIESWMKLSKNAPLDVSIMTNKTSYAEDLLKWVVDNKPEFIKLYNEYHPPYKIDYLLDRCNAGVTQSYDNRYNYPDQVSPFCVG